MDQAQIVICGAGMAGIASAYYLAKAGVRDILIVDEASPLSLTSGNSTEAYRNWWPGFDNAMVALSNRSIDLMDDLAIKTANIFGMNRRGYLYLTAQTDKIPTFCSSAETVSKLGGGPVRIHTEKSAASKYIPFLEDNFDTDINQCGADLFTDSELIQNYFPYVSKDVRAAYHVRRAGWLSAQQLGMYLLNEARKQGVVFKRQRLVGVELSKGQVSGVQLEENGKTEFLRTSLLVNAAGPLIGSVARMVDVDLPIYTELHQKLICNDPLATVPRNAPLLIWDDPQTLLFSASERAAIEAEPELSWLLEEFPSGLHARPEGSGSSTAIVVLWAHHAPSMDPIWPLPEDPYHAEILMRGLAKMIPTAEQYTGNFPRLKVDGGYYTKTFENRPLIGKLPIEGAYIIGALSGFGIMTACAAGELLAAHILGSDVPEYASAFEINRYDNLEYVNLIQNYGPEGQL
jgi:glycine/D-amino acid oxidase-like deaminating enzyme